MPITYGRETDPALQPAVQPLNVNLSAFSAAPTANEMLAVNTARSAPAAVNRPSAVDLATAPQPLGISQDRTNRTSSGMDKPEPDRTQGALQVASSGLGALEAGLTLAKEASTATSTAKGFLAALPGIASGIGAVGSLISMGVQWYYASKQLKAQERASAETSARAGEATAEERRRFQINLDLTNEQLAEDTRRNKMSESLALRKQDFEESTTKEMMKITKADKAETQRQARVAQAISLLMGTIQLFNSPQNREQNYNFWAGRAR